MSNVVNLDDYRPKTARIIRITTPLDDLKEAWDRAMQRQFGNSDIGDMQASLGIGNHAERIRKAYDKPSDSE